MTDQMLQALAQVFPAIETGELMYSGDSMSIEMVIERCETFLAHYLNTYTIVLSKNFTLVKNDEVMPNDNAVLSMFKVERTAVHVSTRCEYHLKFLSVLSLLWERLTLMTDWTTISQREIYYILVGIFKEQRISNQYLCDICNSLFLTRRNIGVVCAPSGYVYGALSIVVPPNGCDGGGNIDCSMAPQPVAYPLVSHTSVFKSNAKCVLVIEKEGIFQRLIADGFANMYSSILITTLGQPSVACRHLVKLLAERLKKPVFGLCDYNPWGVVIMNSIRFGTVGMGMEGMLYPCPQMKWLGLTHTDVEQLPLPQDCFAPLTARDYALIDSLMSRSNVQSVPKMVAELQRMRQRGNKAELQSLYKLHPRFLADKFLWHKIRDNQGI